SGVALLCWQRRDGHIRALAREHHGDGAPDARVAAGDERGLACEFVRRFVFRRFVFRPRAEIRFDAGLRQLLPRKRGLGFGFDLGFRHAGGTCNVWTPPCYIGIAEVAMGLLLALLLLMMIFSVPAWPYSAGWGYYPSGGMFLLVLI